MRKLLISYVFTALCGWMDAFLLPLLIQDLTHSALYTSIAYAIAIVPYLVIMPLAGVLGDYFSKKRIIQFGEIINFLCIAALTVTPLTQSSLGIIMLLHFLLSATTAIHHTVFQAIVPSVVTKKEMVRFNAYASTINNLASLLAPALIGIYLSFGSTLSLLYYIGTGYLVSFLVVSTLHYRQDAIKDKLTIKAFFQALREGFTYVKDQPILKYTVINFFFVNFGETFINANLVHYLKSHHAIDSSQLSYYFLPIGIGAVLGSIAAPVIMQRVAPGRIILIGSALSVISAAFIFVNHSPWVTTSLWGLNEAGASIAIVTFFTVRQRVAPVYLLSRIVAVTKMTGYLAMPIASVSSGWLFEYTDHFPYLLMVSILSISIGILISFRALFHAEDIPTAEDILTPEEV